jgi:hypothetical protein
MSEHGTATTELAFASVESVEVHGLPDEMAWELRTLDLVREDLTLLLPLWAGMVEPDQAGKIVHKTLLAPERYLRPGGLSSVPLDDPGYETVASDSRGGVNLAVNLLLAEGMVRYGYRAEAADLLRRLMGGILEGLRSDHAFRETYQPETPGGLGKRHHLGGVAPLSLFLDILGLRLRTPQRVDLEGSSPFEGRIVVRWRGIEVRKEAEDAQLVFPSGATAHVEGSKPVEVDAAGDADEAML